MWNPLCSNPCWVNIGPCSEHALCMCIIQSLWFWFIGPKIAKFFSFARRCSDPSVQPTQKVLSRDRCLDSKSPTIKKFVQFFLQRKSFCHQSRLQRQRSRDAQTDNWTKVNPNGHSKIRMSMGEALIKEVVVAQVVERWHTVWAGRVLIPGQTLAFLSSELLSIYSHWVSGFF